MKKHSKRFKEADKLVDPDKVYSVEEAVAILKKAPKAKFEETVEISFDLNVDPKKSDQMVRGSVTLPHGTGKKVKVAVFCKGEAETQAKEAGADFVGAEDLIKKVSEGWLGFDCAVATPDMMKDLSRLGKVLGPRGLMPSPKSGTVTKDVAKAIKEVKAGKLDFKIDKQGDIHLGVGKISFEENKICENIRIVLNTLLALKPASVKGQFIKNAAVSSTMGPGIRIQS